MAREEKIAKVEEIKGILESSSGIIFTDHTGLNAESIYDIRTRLYEINARIRIIKNTITLLAAKQVYDEIDFSEVLTGPTSIISGDDIIVAAKLAKEFAGDHETFNIKAGVIDGKLYDSGSIKKIASLPAKEVLISQVIGLMGNPLTRLATVLNNIGTNLVSVINMIKTQKEKQAA